MDKSKNKEAPALTGAAKSEYNGILCDNRKVKPQVSGSRTDCHLL